MTKPIRVLQVFGTMNRGGAETMIMNLYRNINRDKVQFDFVVHHRNKGDFDNEIYDLGGRIFYISSYKFTNHFLYIKEWENLLKDHEEWNIIHGHMYSTASIYLKVAKKLGRYTISHSHSTSNGKGALAFLKDIIQIPLKNIPDTMMACSNEAGKWLYGSDVINKENYIMFPNAIDLSLFSFNKKERAMIRKELNFENKIIIGHVGRYEYPKNFPFLLEIINKLKEVNKNFLLLQIGNGKNNKDLQTMIKDKNLEDNIKFLGVRNDVADLMQAMDLFIFPSIYEGLPVVLIEAQASGLQCIVSSNITKEVDITKSVSYLPVDKGVNIWVDSILNSDFKYNRNANKDVLERAGYDIKNSAHWIENFYIQKNNKVNFKM